MSGHITYAQFEQLASGQVYLAPKAILRMLLHLSRGCETCEARFGNQIRGLFHLPPEIEEEPSYFDYDDILDEVFEGFASTVAIGNEPNELSSPQEADTPSPSSGIERVETYLRQSFAERARNPKQMWVLANWACLAADNLDVEQLGLEAVSDARAHAWTEYANACRVVEKLEEAEASLTTASKHFALGSHHPVLLARQSDVYASLLRTLGKNEEASLVLERVEHVYRTAGDLHLAGRALVKRGIVERYRANPSFACELFEQGITNLDFDRDPSLYHSARQSYIATLVDRGDYRRARRELLESGLRKAFDNEPLNQLKLTWLEGEIAEGMKRHTQAVASYASVRESYLALGMTFEAGVVGLDLAALLAEMAQLSEAESLTREIFKAFESHGVAAEATRALRLLAAVTDRKALDAFLIRDVRNFLDRLSRDRHAIYEPREA